MPNFHPQLVAAVAPLLEPGEEVWAVYAGPERSLVATATHLFLLRATDTAVFELREFAEMRRPRPSLVLLRWRVGGALRIALDPLDEHGIQALTVIGLLVASIARPHAQPLDGPAPASVAPSDRQLLASRRYVLRSAGKPGAEWRSWTNGWLASHSQPRRHARTCRHGYRLGSPASATAGSAPSRC